MTANLSIDAHTQAVVGALRASTSWTVADGYGSDLAGTPLTPPYWVVSSVSAQLGEAADLADPFAGGLLIVQVAGVHKGQRGADVMRSTARQVLLGWGLVVSGRSVFVGLDGGGSTDVDRLVDPPVFVGVERFRLGSWST